MKKTLFIAGMIAAAVLSGCQQIQDQANSLSQQSADAINGFSQQANNIKTQVLQTKAAYDEKAQEVQNTINDVNKLTH